MGCMRDSQQIPRPLPSKVISRAEEGKEAFKDKKKWDEFIKLLVCDCAVETRKKGWFTFGIQNYGKQFGSICKVIFVYNSIIDVDL